MLAVVISPHHGTKTMVLVLQSSGLDRNALMNEVLKGQEKKEKAGEALTSGQMAWGSDQPF